MKTPLLVVLGCALAAAAQTASPDDLSAWRQFVSDLRAGNITAADLRPYDENLRAPMLGYLSTMRRQVPAAEWDATPELYRVSDQLHALIPLTLEGTKATYCLTLVKQDGRWFFQHLESIFIRLDRTAAPPVSVFPDVSEEHKAWMREETRAHEQVSVFNLLAREKGKPFAFDFFRDGYGYFLAARAWVPFVPPPRAFILYACWEQANLRGNRVTLESLSDNQARVRMDLTYFRLYQQSAHLSQQIGLDDYRRLFETIWQDRAQKAGWNLNLACKDAECVFDFRKPAEAHGS